MSQDQQQPESSRSWLEDRLERLGAVYRKFGRAGLAEHPLPDVNLLLQAKALAFRDLPKGRDLTERQKAESRQLELEVSDLTAYVHSQLALVGSPGLRLVRGLGGPAQQQHQQAPQQRGHQKRHVEHDRG